MLIINILIMENIYDNVKVGDIVYAGDKPNRQIFFIHNIVETEPREIISSGFNEGGGIVYPKLPCCGFCFIANEEEKREFMEIAIEKGYKFDRNNGFSR